MGRRAASGLALLVALALVAPVVGTVPSDGDLRAQAARESLVPIRPGPPFWNGHGRQFIYAPAFEFPGTPPAAAYRLTVVSRDGTARSFEAATPTAPLVPVWSEVPAGPVTLRVEALDKPGGVPTAVLGTRAFHRAAAFNGPYGTPVLPYGESSRVALDTVIREPFVQHWLTTGEPDPAYPLYRYSSKVIGSLISGCATYARQSPRPADAEDSLRIGRRAADFLIGVSGPAGTPLEYMPPTYHGAKPTERENDRWTMTMSPAEAGQGYLDLYDATRAAKYLDAARRIAGTYGKLQNTGGTWALKVDNHSGEPLAPLELVPSVVISFLDRLVVQYGVEECRGTRDRAVRWMMEHPVRTFDWQAQFDDAKLRGAYENLAKHEACEFATYLFRHAKEDSRNVAVATELLQFAEDQFITWEHPPEIPPRVPDLDPKLWITPCSTEQYAMFEPISGSSAFMIVAYVRAYEATGDQLHLAKARSLANGLTVAQQVHHGRYPTRMVKDDLAYWVNSTINSARAMRILAAVEPGTTSRQGSGR